jgi:nicotinate dehydrogenase subunit A
MNSPTASVRCTVNGRALALDLNPEIRLLYVLRNDLGLKGTRYGCGAGDCGTCMVLIDGRAVNACDTPLWAVEGKAVTTVEALDEPDGMPILAAMFTTHQAAQCGYCTSGILVSAAALLGHNPNPDEAAVRAALDRNLCRCGIHQRAVAAVLAAAREMQT